MKTIFLFFAFFATAVNMQASYFEDWIIEAKVSRIYNEEEKAKLIKEHPEISAVAKHNIGLQVTIEKCIPVGRHGGTKCSEGKTLDIVMSYDPELIKFSPAQNMLLRIKYTFSEGISASGVVSELHQWQLVEVLPEANKKNHNKSHPPTAGSRSFSMIF